VALQLIEDDRPFVVHVAVAEARLAHQPREEADSVGSLLRRHLHEVRHDLLARRAVRPAVQIVHRPPERAQRTGVRAEQQMLVEVGEALVVRVLGEGTVPHGDEHGGERRAAVLRDDQVEAVLETRLVERRAGLQCAASRAPTDMHAARSAPLASRPSGRRSLMKPLQGSTALRRGEHGRCRVVPAASSRPTPVPALSSA